MGTKAIAFTLLTLFIFVQIVQTTKKEEGILAANPTGAPAGIKHKNIAAEKPFESISAEETAEALKIKTDDNKYTYEQKKKELENTAWRFVNLVKKGPFDLLDLSEITMPPKNILSDLISKAHIPYFLFALFVLGCNMSMFGVKHRVFNIFLIVSFYMFQAVNSQLNSFLESSFMDSLTKTFEMESLLDYISERNPKLVISTIICLAFSVALCWVINMFFRLTAIAVIAYFVMGFCRLEEISKIPLKTKLTTIVFALILVLVAYKILHKNLEKYIFVGIFGFFSSLFIILPVSEYFDLGFTLSAILLNYTPTSRAGPISLNSEYLTMGVLTLLSVGLQSYTCKKRK